MTAYSYSSLKQFSNCPRNYYETKVLKKWQQAKTEQIIYGEAVHKALEDHIKSDIPLGPHERFAGVAATIKALPGRKITEYKMAVDSDLNPCDFFSKDVFMRGVADVTVVNTPKALVIDYKSGKANYPDPDQLELMSLMLFRHLPEVEQIKGALLFILYDKVITANYDRKNSRAGWIKWIAKTEEVEKAAERGIFRELPSGLCGWCPVKDCPHHKERR